MSVSEVFSEAQGRKTLSGERRTLGTKFSRGLGEDEAEPRKLSKIRLTQVQLNGPGDSHLGSATCPEKRRSRGPDPGGADPEGGPVEARPPREGQCSGPSWLRTFRNDERQAADGKR